jgi:hypothetical protein
MAAVANSRTAGIAWVFMVASYQCVRSVVAVAGAEPLAPPTRKMKALSSAEPGR